MPEAGIIRHLTSKPSLSRSSCTCLSTMPSWMLIIPSTFSPINHLGLHSLMTLIVSSQRKRSSSVPLLFPAVENGWQGNPPVMTSAWYMCPLTFLISSIIGMFLKFFCNTFWQNLSFSTKAIVSKWPVASSPKLKPPMPLNKSKTVSLWCISSPYII